jgi:hypothetical protein
MSIQGEMIDFLPFTENPIHDISVLKTLSPRKKGDKRLLCSHLAVDGAKLNAFTEADVVVENDGEMVKIDQEFMAGWTQVYLGHYHDSQVLGKNKEIEYIGSPLELTNSEAFCQKHIILHDLDTFEKKYIVNDFSPKHLILKPEQLNKHDLAHHFVTVVMPSTASQTEMIEIRRDILNNHEVASLQFKHGRDKKDTTEDQKAIKDAKSLLESQDKMLERYIAECTQEELEGLDLNILLEIGRRIIETDPNNEDAMVAAKDALHPALLASNYQEKFHDAVD